MKAMILAAGKGERMRPLTVTTPKALLQVKGQPLLAYHLKALQSAGVTEVVINTHYLGEQIVAAIGDGSDFGLKVSYSPESVLLNTGGGVVKALNLLGSEPFIVVSADIFTDFPLRTLPRAPTGLAHVVMVDNPEYHPAGDFVLQSGKIKLSGANKLTYANIGVYRPEFFAHAPQGAVGLGELLAKNIADDLVEGQYYSGVWYNVGTPLDLSMVNSLA